MQHCLLVAHDWNKTSWMVRERWKTHSGSWVARDSALRVYLLHSSPVITWSNFYSQFYTWIIIWHKDDLCWTRHFYTICRPLFLGLLSVGSKRSTRSVDIQQNLGRKFPIPASFKLTFEVRSTCYNVILNYTSISLKFPPSEKLGYGGVKWQLRPQYFNTYQVVLKRDLMLTKWNSSKFFPNLIACSIIIFSNRPMVFGLCCRIQLHV
jgi:hypothetical protein